MSRTILCVLTAAILIAVSAGIMVARQVVLGNDVKLPTGPSNWKVALAVQGVAEGPARVTTANPLDVGRQHVLRENFSSTHFANKETKMGRPGRRSMFWTLRPGTANGPVRLRCEFNVALKMAHPNGLMERTATGIYAAPRPGEFLGPVSPAGLEDNPLSETARRLTEGLDNPTDLAEAIYHFVDREVGNEPSIDGPAVGPVECLSQGSGDSAAKSRLLAALLRNRGLPARLVTGLTLNKGPEQRAHTWVEAWVHDRWLPMCPFWHHFGRVPATYLIFGFGDLPIVRGRNVKDLDYAFLVERVAAETPDQTKLSAWHRAFDAVSLFLLPPSERKLVEVLLLLPVAALIICVFRNVIGMRSFGTFAPALIGLAFRELHSLPGMLVFAAILLVGWLLRRALDPYHLLQVPRVSFMLSLIILVLIGLIVAANYFGAAATTYIALFPMVILTGMVERFWTLEVEDGTAASFKTLLHTLFIATIIAIVLSLTALPRHLFRYPETLGLVMAAQLLIGRYTGYRLTELWRFRDLVKPFPA